MFETKPTRREVARLAAGSAVALGALAASATSASAYQGNMENALSSLFAALNELKAAQGPKGGHRVVAIDLVQQAISETQAGIAAGGG